MKIATLVNQSGGLIGLHEPGNIELFECVSGLWVKLQVIPFALHQEMGIRAVRSKLEAIFAQLEDCTSILTGELKGATGAMLKDIGFSVWTATGLALDMLDEVATAKELESIEVYQKPPTKPDHEPQLVGDIRDGVYQIDLQEILKCNSGHPSRNILIPILGEKLFQRLDIFCDHMPRCADTKTLEDGRGLQISVSHKPA